MSKGKFSFSSEIYETYEICFISKVPPSNILVDCIIDKKFKFSMISFTALRGVVQEVSLITKKGVETKSYEGVSSN